MLEEFFIDSGRNRVKPLYGTMNFAKSFPAVISPATDISGEDDIDLKKENYLWIKNGADEFFIGDLALEYGGNLLQDRSQDKTSSINIKLILAAISQYVTPGATVDLYTNCPVRDLKSQKVDFAGCFKKKNFVITHKAGRRKGMAVDFYISNTTILPEHVASFYGWAYNDKLEKFRSEYFEGDTLVLDGGDQTFGYAVFRDGQRRPEECGTTDEGYHKAIQQIIDWLDGQGVHKTQAEFNDYFLKRKPIFIGKTAYDCRELISQYEPAMYESTYSDLSGKFNGFKRFRNILCGGGTGHKYATIFHDRLGKICNIDVPDPEDAIWLNVRGFRIMKRLANIALIAQRETR